MEDGEVTRPAPEAGALRLGHRLLRRPEAGEPQRLRLAAGRQLGLQEGEFFLAERGGERGRGPVHDLLDVDPGPGPGHMRPYDRDRRLGAVGERDVQRGQGPAMQTGDVRAARLVVVDPDLRRKDRSGALAPQPLPHRVLHRDPAQQPLPAPARRMLRVLRTLHDAQGVAHDEIAGCEVGPALVEQGPAAGAGLGQGVALGEALDRLGLRVVVEAPVLPAGQLCPHHAVDRELYVGFEHGVGERGDPHQALHLRARARMGAVEAHLAHADREDDGAFRAGRHDPIAQDLAHVVEQGAGGGRCGDDAAYVAVADRGEFGDSLERRAVEHPAFVVEMGRGVVGDALGGRVRAGVRCG